jgi:hypothetical protein
MLAIVQTLFSYIKLRLFVIVLQTNIMELTTAKVSLVIGVDIKVTVPIVLFIGI